MQTCNVRRYDSRIQANLCIYMFHCIYTFVNMCYIYMFVNLYVYSQLISMSKQMYIHKYFFTYI